MHKAVLRSVLLSLISLFTIGVLSAQSLVSIPFKRVEGYSLIDGKQPRAGFFGLLFVRDRQFDLYFKKDLATDKTSKIDFGKKTVITLMGPKTLNETNLSVEKVTRLGNKLEIYFVSKIGKKKRKEMLPSCLYTIDKQQNVYSLVYYLDGKVLEDVKN